MDILVPLHPVLLLMIPALPETACNLVSDGSLVPPKLPSVSDFGWRGTRVPIESMEERPLYVHEKGVPRGVGQQQGILAECVISPADRQLGISQGDWPLRRIFAFIFYSCLRYNLDPLGCQPSTSRNTRRAAFTEYVSGSC